VDREGERWRDGEKGRDSGIDRGRRREREPGEALNSLLCATDGMNVLRFTAFLPSHGTDFGSESNTGVMCTGAVQPSPVHSDPDLPSGSGGGCGDRSSTVL